MLPDQRLVIHLVDVIARKGQHENAPQLRIDAIRQCNIDDPVDSAKGYGGLGAISRKRKQTLALAARQQANHRVARYRMNAHELSLEAYRDLMGRALVPRRNVL